jgi:hypothetical protein
LAEIGLRSAPVSGLSGVGIGQVDAGRGQLVEALHHVVPGQVGHLEGQPEALGQRPDLLGQPGRIEPAGVADDADAAVQAGTQDVLELGEERACVPGCGVLLLGLPQDKHGQLGEVVTGEHIDRSALDHLPSGLDAVTIEPGAVGDPHRPRGHRVLSGRGVTSSAPELRSSAMRSSSRPSQLVRISALCSPTWAAPPRGSQEAPEKR